MVVCYDCGENGNLAAEEALSVRIARGRRSQKWAIVAMAVFLCLIGCGCQQLELEPSVSPTDRAHLGDALMVHIRSGWSVEDREASTHRNEVAYLGEKLEAADVIAVLSNFELPEEPILRRGQVLIYYQWKDFEERQNVKELLLEELDERPELSGFKVLVLNCSGGISAGADQHRLAVDIVYGGVDWANAKPALRWDSDILSFHLFRDTDGRPRLNLYAVSG